MESNGEKGAGKVFCEVPRDTTRNIKGRGIVKLSDRAMLWSLDTCVEEYLAAIEPHCPSCGILTVNEAPAPC